MSTENPTYLERALEAGAIAHGAVYDATGGAAMTAELVGAVVGAVEDFIREDERWKVEAALEDQTTRSDAESRIRRQVADGAGGTLVPDDDIAVFVRESFAAALAALNASPETQEPCERCGGSEQEHVEYGRDGSGRPTGTYPCRACQPETQEGDGPAQGLMDPDEERRHRLEIDEILAEQDQTQGGDSGQGEDGWPDELTVYKRRGPTGKPTLDRPGTASMFGVTDSESRRYLPAPGGEDR